MDNIYKAVQLTIDSQNLALSKTPTHVYIANQYVDTNDTPLITAPFIIQKALENGAGVVDIVSSTIGSIYEVRLLCDAEVLISGYFYMPPMNVNFSELELYTSYPPRTPPVVNEFWQKTENFILEKTNTLLNFVQVFNSLSSMRLSLGYLEELATTKKSNLVSAINEIFHNITSLKYKIDRVIDIRDFGAKCDGVIDDTDAIQAALDDMTSGSELNFGSGRILISKSLDIKKSNVILKGDLCTLITTRDNDIALFTANNLKHINIKGFVSSNTTTAQTFIKASTTHHLHIEDVDLDGTKLFADLFDCYWFSTNKVRMQSIWQAFNFRGAVTAFDLRNTSINGAGIPSYIEQSIGGNITGCSFEAKSGRLKILRSFGLNISGNYFEGYVGIDNYIDFGSSNYKVMNGVNVTGNLFYAGATAGIKLNNVDGINIAGNYFGTTHAVELYSFDASNQTNCSYIANTFTGTPDKEFLISGKTQQASLSPEYGMPILFKQQQIGARTLNSGEAQIYNKNGALAIKTPTMDSAITTFSDMVTFFQANKMFVNKTYTNMLTSTWRLANATSQADPSLSGALLITLAGGVALVRQTVATVVNNKYYLAARVKINNPVTLRLGYTDGGEIANYPTPFDYTATMDDYKYLTVAFTASSATSTVGFTAGGGKSGDTFSIVDWVLIDLTSKYGVGNELSKDMLDSAIKL